MRLGHRATPLYLLAFVGAALGAVTLAEQTFQRRLLVTEAISAEYRSALVQTRGDLKLRMQLMSSDNTLLQNLNWRLTHSVQGTLEGQLERGSLDQLTLFTSNCQEVGRASFAHALPTPCPFAAPLAGHTKDTFWLEDEGQAVMAMVQPLSGSDASSVAAVGAVALGEQWLALQPRLKKGMEDAGLHLAKSGGVALAAAPQPFGGEAAATLRSDQLIDRLLARPSVRHWFFATSLVWPCLLILFVCVLAALWREHAATREDTQALAAFTAWCRGLTSHGPVLIAASPTDVKQPSLSLRTGLPQARQLVNHALQLKADAMHGLSQKRHSLENQLKAREEELQKLQVRLCELAELDSLAVQLQRTTAMFLRRMDQFHSQAEDLRDVVSEVLGQESAALIRLSASWRDGIGERGARKFIRSLAETPAANPDVSELDEQLQHFLAHSQQAQELTFNAGRMVDQLLADAGFAAKIAGLWHALALKSTDSEPCEALLPAIEQAQALVVLEPSLAAVAFNNLAAASFGGLLPEVPQALWTSAFYHVYLAMAELAKGSAARIDTRLRQDSEKTLLIVQVCTSDPAMPQRSDREAYHLEIARAILSPFHVTLSVLPAVAGPYPIVLSWRSDGPSAASGRPRQAELGEASTALD